MIFRNDTMAFFDEIGHNFIFDWSYADGRAVGFEDLYENYQKWYFTHFDLFLSRMRTNYDVKG